MTRKDYVLIAAAIHDALYDQGTDDARRAAVCEVAQSVGRALSDDNSRFDMERFLKACGVQS